MWMGGIFLVYSTNSVFHLFFVNQSGQFNPVRSDLSINIIV